MRVTKWGCDGGQSLGNSVPGHVGLEEDGGLSPEMGRNGVSRR